MESTRIDDIVKRLIEELPEAAINMGRDLENNFRAVLQSTLGKLDLTTRTEFDVQARVLERTRTRVEELERRLAELEQRLAQQPRERPRAD
jgi:BMFP domain-containing protein YqiC